MNLDCSDNRLTVLPPLPLCKRLNCSDNQLTFLPRLPRCSNPKFDNNPIDFYLMNLAWLDSQQQAQTKQQLRRQLSQQQKRQIQRTGPISLDPFVKPTLANDYAIYQASTLQQVPFKGMRGIDVTKVLPLEKAVQDYMAQQNQGKKTLMKKDIAKYIALIQSLRKEKLERLQAQELERARARSRSQTRTRAQAQVQTQAQARGGGGGGQERGQARGQARGGGAMMDVGDIDWLIDAWLAEESGGGGGGGRQARGGGGGGGH
jgi:hypothetical protein